MLANLYHTQIKKKQYFRVSKHELKKKKELFEAASFGSKHTIFVSLSFYAWK